MRMAAVAVVLVGSGCTSPADTATSPITPDPAEPATTSTVPTSITTLPATTTTSQPATTTEVVDVADLAPVGLLPFTTTEGWEYVLAFGEPTPTTSQSPGGCVDVPAPGLANVMFTVGVINVLDDRAAPTPELAFAANLANGGGFMSGDDPFDESMTTERLLRGVEVWPNAPDQPCFLAANLYEDLLDLPAAGSDVVLVVVGPVPEDRLSELIVGVRAFEQPGSWTEATFGTDAGSLAVNPESTGITD